MTIDIKYNDLKKRKEKAVTKENLQRKDAKKASNKEKKKVNIKKIVIWVIVLAILGVIGTYIYKIYSKGRQIGFKLNPTTILSTKEPELKRDSSQQFTNIAIIGIDTRENSTLLNTDTIILASYNYSTNNTTMISIPRDFHVEVEKGKRYYQRINYIYSYYEGIEKGTGIPHLIDTIAEITGQEIQYYAMVDFKAFVQIIDSVGGVDVNVENSFTDYMYPEGIGYKTVKFVAGPQTMNGKTALEYSRSRHSMQNNEGSDYARARRQQKVITALQNKILSSETLLDPKKIMNIISSIADNIRISEFTQDDLKAAMNIGNRIKDGNGTTFSFVLDPTAGGSQLIEVKKMESGAYAIGPVDGLGQYGKILEYINLVQQKPYIYANNPTIYVYNTGIGTNAVALQKTNQLKKDFPYINIIFSYARIGSNDGTVVFPTSEKYMKLTEELAKNLKTENMIKPEGITSQFGHEGAAILLGKETQLSQETKSEI